MWMTETTYNERQLTFGFDNLGIGVMQAILNISGKKTVSREMLISLTRVNDKISRNFFNIPIKSNLHQFSY